MTPKQATESVNNSINSTGLEVSNIQPQDNDIHKETLRPSKRLVPILLKRLTVAVICIAMLLIGIIVRLYLDAKKVILVLPEWAEVSRLRRSNA